MSDGYQPRPGGGRSLSYRVLAGGLWGLVGTGGQVLLAFASSVVIARYLVPTDYAVVAIAGAVMGIASRFGHVGLAEAIVRQRGDVAALCRSSLTALLAGGALLGLAVAALAPWLASFYGDPRLVPVLPLLAVTLVLGMVSGVPRALLQRELRLKELNLLDVAQRAVVAVAGIVLALLGYGYWALIAPGVLAMALVVPVLFRLARLRPSLSIDPAPLRASFRFGSGVFAARTLSVLCDDLDYFVLGRYLPAREYGLYHFAYVRARQPYTMIGPAVQEPLFAAFSEMGGDVGRLRRAALRVASMHFFIFAPLFVALFLVADPLIPFVFGEQWAACVDVTRAFCLLGLLPAAGGFTGSALLALGRSWLMTGLNVVRLVAVAAALAWGVTNGADMLTIAVALVAANAVVLTGHLFVLYRLLGARAADVARAYGPTLASLLVAAGAWLTVEALGLRDVLHALPGLARGGALFDLALLALFGLVYGIAFGGASLTLNRGVLDELRQFFEERRGRA